MKTLDLKSLIIGVLITMLIVAFMLVVTTSSTRAWEYKSIYVVGRGDDPTLNGLGAEGWELVGYSYSKHPTGQGNDYTNYVLKRAKRSNLKWKFWK